MVLSTKNTVRIADFYFDEPSVPVKADVIRFVQTARPVPGADEVPFHTILIDLTKDEDWLLAHCRNNTRYEILRAQERDQLEYLFWRTVDSSVMNAFCDFFDSSSRLKGQELVSRPRLWALADAGVLDLSVVRRQGEDLVWHAQYRAPERIRLIETASLFRASEDAEYKKLIGRANRYHHWRDMMRFKAEGALIYDFGGCVPGTTDPQLIGINRFKEGFGGEMVENYHAQFGVTIKGKIALRLQDKVLGSRGALQWIRLLKSPFQK